MKKTIFILSSACLFLSLASATASAKPEGHRKPPQEAIDACENSKVGDQVSFKTRKGKEVSGTCQSMREDKSLLIAVPEGHEKRGENQE